MTDIRWKPRARKQLMKLPQADRGKVYAAIGSLASWPSVRNVKALESREWYRLRVGRYRVLFTVDSEGGVKVITIEQVSKRDERTYSQ